MSTFIIYLIGDIMREYLIENLSYRTRKDIYTELGMSSTSFQRLLVKEDLLDYARKFNKNRTVDEIQFLNPIGNHFYFLGLMLSDGWISKNNDIGIRLSIKDKQIIDDLIEFLDFKGKLHIVKSGLGGNVCQFSFRSKVVQDFLNNHGVSSNKTLSENYKNIPDEYFYDFLRGFIDGDGNIYQGRISMYSGGPVLDSIKEDLHRINNIETVFYKTQTKIKHLAIRSTEVKSKNVVDLIYGRPGLRLKRKEESLRRWFNEHRTRRASTKKCS